MKYCTNCGNELRENAKFCEKCGTIRAGGTPNQQVISTTPPQTQNKNSNKTLIIVLVAIVACILLGIVSITGVVFYGLNKAMAEYDDLVNEYYDYDDYNYNYELLGELSVDNLYINYPSDWEEILRPEENEALIIRDNSTISINVEETNKTSEVDVKNEIITYMSQYGYTLGEMKKVYLSDTWDKYSFSSEDNVFVIIFKVEDNLIYKFNYVAPKSDYTAEKYDIEDIYSTLEIRDLVAK